MKLFLISQTTSPEYDAYDSAIVCANDEDDAKTIHPYEENPNWDGDSWCRSPSYVSAKYIGEASIDLRRGVILASFNGG